MSNQKIKTIFIGTSDFGVESLRKLIKCPDFDIVGVITQPDKKMGRKQELTPSPIKKEAQKHNLDVWQPKSIKNYTRQASTGQLHPSSEYRRITNLDIIVVVAYGQILPESILKFPKYGCINVHGSLLPYCRGASCIQGPILGGDSETGVTIMKMDEGLDTGPILVQEKIKIMPADTAGKVFDKLASLGAKMLIPAIKDYVSGKIKPIPQSSAGVTVVKKLTRDDGHINWKKSAEEIERFVRAMTPWPGAFSKLNNKIIKIIEIKSAPLAINKHEPGTIFYDNNILAIQCAKNALIIKKLQLEGKKITTDQEFICGHQNLLKNILE